MGGLFDYKKEAVRYDRLKNSDKAQTSVIFGVETIVFAIIGFAIIIAMRFLVGYFNEFMGDLGGTSITASLMEMFNLLIHVLFGFASLTQYANAGIKCYFQFKLNDRVIKWVALGLACAFFIAGIVLFVLTAVAFL